MKKQKDINKLISLMKEWTKKQGIDLNEEQYKLIFGLAESLGIKDIGDLTLFYTTGIMPLLKMFIAIPLKEKKIKG